MHQGTSALYSPARGVVAVERCERTSTRLLLLSARFAFQIERLVGLAEHAGRMAHSLEPRRTSSHRFERRATAPACTSSSNLYTHPQASDTLPVYEDITLEWNPGCVTIDSSTVDLYLNVEEDSGWLAVHEWTNVQYAQGKLDTQLKPGWWNASTGAGQVSAQVRSLVLFPPRRNHPLTSLAVRALHRGCLLLAVTALARSVRPTSVEHARARRTRFCNRLQRIASPQSA